MKICEIIHVLRHFCIEETIKRASSRVTKYWIYQVFLLKSNNSTAFQEMYITDIR